MSIDACVAAAARRLSDLGFRLESEHGGWGASRLMVAIRDTPTIQHFDPEFVTYWESNAEGRGRRRELDGGSPMPARSQFAWGSIDLIDRFGIRNDFVSLGGDLLADRTEATTTVVVFSSLGPILSLGGHSQPTDRAGLEIGAFFGRMMVPIDFMPGVEQAISAASPLDRYTAFVQYEARRLDGHRQLREDEPERAARTVAEVRRLQSAEPMAWTAGARLLERMQLPV